MAKYGQFCPVAKSLELLGDQWTLLIIRDMLSGICHFNDLERGLPGISRALLASRLRHLQRAGIIEKHLIAGHRQSTEYALTQAGHELEGVISALMVWGEAWAFSEPAPDELDPVLLMWWLRSDVQQENLPQPRLVVQFDFELARRTFWLVMTKDDVTLCLTDPGYEVDVFLTGDLRTFYELWWGQVSYQQAVSDQNIRLEGNPQLARQFPTFFRWSAAHHMAGITAMRTVR